MSAVRDDLAIGRPFDGRPIIAVIRHHDRGVAGQIAAAAVAVLSAVEVTYTVPGASSLISALCAHPRVRRGEALVGAGTVRDAATAEAAIAAGATFLVAPDFDADVAAIAAEAGIAYVPGAFTPTEVFRAARHGIRTVKLFPAGSLGPAFLTAMTAVAPDLAFVATGGLGPADAAAWFSAGAHAIGVGSSLGRAHQIGGRDAVDAEVAMLAALAPTPWPTPGTPAFATPTFATPTDGAMT